MAAHVIELAILETNVSALDLLNCKLYKLLFRYLTEQVKSAAHDK